MNDPATAPLKKHLLRAALQVVGFLTGLALLGWCVSVALRPENQEKLAMLREAHPGLILGLLALSLLSLVLNGLVFWVTIRPVRPIGLLGMLSTNALATCLNYLPFKIGVLTRVIIHNRRDGVPVLTIGAWFMAMGVILLGALAPLVLASLWRQRADATWYAASGAGLVLAWALIVGVAKPLSGPGSLRRFQNLGGPWHRRLTNSRFFAQFHAGVGLLAHGRTVGAAIALRLADVALQTARFMVAAAILQAEFPADRALIAASTYFLIGILSPSGMLGTREGGTAALLTIPGLASSQDASWFAAATLLVGAAELIVNFAGAALGLAYLRPDHLLRSEVLSAMASPTPAAPGDTPDPDRGPPGG